MVWYATNRDIHCSWSVPKPSLDVLSREYELPYASFCNSLVSPRHFPPRLTLKMHTKCVMLSTFSVQKTGCYSTMRGIHCLWSVSKPSLGAPDRWKELRCASSCRFIGLTELCSTKVDYQNAHKIPDVGYPLSTKMGCHSNRRGIHCLWSISNPSSDVWDWWEELLIASVYQLLVPLGHFLPRLALKLHAKCHIWDTLSVQKIWDADLQGETSIAYEVLQNLS